MKLKEIKPGMVIHCKTENEAENLFSVLKSMDITWNIGSPLRETHFSANNKGNGMGYYLNKHGRLEGTDIDYYIESEMEITPFSSLIIEEKTYEDGLNEAWSAARKIVLRKEHGGLPCEDLEKIFDRELEYEAEYSVFKNLTPQEAISRLKSHEQEMYMRENTKVGDVVVNIKNNNVKLLVTAIYGDYFDGIRVGKSDAHGELGGCFSCSSFGAYERTGTNIDISSILEEIEKEEA